MPKKPQTATFEGRRVTARGRRYLASRAPKLREDVKSALFLRGSKTSELSTGALRSLYNMSKPDAQFLNRRRDIRPFEDASELERLIQHHDTALFGVASHSKKRPDNLILGRCFDGHLLDMFEFKVEEYSKAVHKMIGMKPCLVFLGDWEQDDRIKRLKNFLVDFLRGPDVDRVNLAGLEHVIVVGISDNTISIAPNRLRLTKSSTRVPNVALEPASAQDVPLKLELRRDHAPSFELWKLSLKQPKELKPKKRKNISTTSIGDTVGKIHVAKQDLDSIQVRKVRALKKTKVDHEQEDEEE